MNKDWLVLVQKFDEASARTKFEDICVGLYRFLHPEREPRTVEVRQGDGGIDIFMGNIGIEPIDVIQCKFFISGIGESQKDQIRQSFRTAIESREYIAKSWTLCIINLLDLQQNKWWSTWKKNTEEKYKLPNNFIHLKDGNEIIDLLKQHNLYNTSFELEDSIKIREIHDTIVKGNTAPKINIDLRDILKTSSYALLQVRNYIEYRANAHIVRNEVKSVYDWVTNEIPYNQKNVLVLKGEKGLGKSGILKDLYEALVLEKHNVIGIKADKFYCKSILELESNLFENQISFDNIIKIVTEKKEKLIVLIDQIDAMSLTLSSSREYIETYNKLIYKLQHHHNIRIIISSRSYDLKYDAELSIYNSDIYKKVEVNLLSFEEVKSILTSFNINCSSIKVLELLRTPNHLDIYCRIFENNSNAEADSISTLKDLYDHLWQKYISPEKELRLKELIYTIAQRMYHEQRISVGNIYEDDYFKEIGYLKSNSLLVEYSKEIQFFHQTFYEYSFAKQFVDNQGNLEDFIIENKQSLYVRSVIKMVIEYFRESKISKYVDTIRNILTSSKYRFHIKSLLISNLGFVKNPCNLEKTLVIDTILEDAQYEDVFLSSIQSENWVKFFIEEGIVLKYFSLKRNNFNTDEEYKFKKQKYSNYNWFMFVNNMHHNSMMILDYLESIDFEEKDSFISNLIIYINDWSNKDLLPIFENYIPFQEESKGNRDNHYHFEILKKIFPNNKVYAYEKLGIAIIDFYEKFEFNYRFEYSLNEIVKHFCKIEPLESFTYLFSVYKIIVEKTKIPYFSDENILCTFYRSSKINDSNTHRIYSGENGLEDYLEEFILNSRNSFFSKFYQNYKNSDDTLLIKFLIKKLNINPNLYIDEILEFIEILVSKNIFLGKDDDLQLQLRILISNIYKSLDKSQTDFIDNILLNISTTYDYWLWTDENGKRRISLNEFGKKKYLFIKALPNDMLVNNPKLYKVYQELKRKFGDLNHNEAQHLSRTIWRGGAPPLVKSAYDKMTLKHWKKSMIKYNETHKSKDGFSSNIEEHSNSFKDCVKDNPEKFYNFIESLFDDDQISKRYILRGIWGLIDGNYNPDKVKEVYKKFISLNTNNNFYKSMINHHASYFIQNKNIDEEIVQYLSDLALSYPDKEVEHNPTMPLHDAINSIRGSAVNELMHCFYDKKFEEIIFSTVEKVIENPDCTDSLKIMILNDLAYLNHLDIKRAFKIFVKLTDTNNIEFLKHSINPSQYFNNRFHNQMDYYFEKIIETPEIHKQSYVMISSWLLGLDSEKKLYNNFIKTSKEAKLCAIDVAENFLIDEVENTINFKALDILSEFLSETDKDFAGEYSCVILRKFKPENFQQFFPFLKDYSKTILCRKDPRYFLQYLSLCSKNHPEECLELLGNIDFKDNPNIQDSGYYDKEPIQLVLGIYSKLVSEIIKNNTLINIALDIFDGMLVHRHLRNNANQAIEELK